MVQSILEKVAKIIGEKGHIEEVGWNNRGKLDSVLIYFTIPVVTGETLSRLEALGRIDYVGIQLNPRSGPERVLAVGLDLEAKA